jgi:hypothetical protein
MQTTRYYPSYLFCMFQKVVSDDYENNKQYYINKCVDRPSLLHSMWLRTCDREDLTCCKMCEGFWESGGFLARPKKQKYEKG